MPRFAAAPRYLTRFSLVRRGLHPYRVGTMRWNECNAEGVQSPVVNLVRADAGRRCAGGWTGRMQ